jgi:hypothetical protein
MSSYGKLSRPTTLVLTLFCLLQIIPAPKIHAAAITMQAPEGMSQQLDATLAKYFENSYASVYTFENRISQLTEAKGIKPQEIEIATTVEGHSMGGVAPSAFPPGSSPQVWGWVMNSELIVIGTPLQSRSLPIEDRTFVFTEYAIKVEKVLAPEHSSVLPGDTIIVSRGGGEITVDNVLVKAIDTAFGEFLLNQTYILMLRSVPGTTSYRAYAGGTYAVKGDRVSNISTIEKSTAPPKDLSSFVADVNAALERKSAVAQARKRSGRN